MVVAAPAPGETIKGAFTAALGVALGAWTDYSSSFVLTATTTNPTKGGSTYTARYVQIGQTIIYQFRILIGAGFAVGSGNYRISLPVAAQASAPSIARGTAFLNDAATASRLGILRVATSTYLQVEFLNGASVVLLGDTGPGSAWTTGDAVDGSIIYEAA